MLGTEKYSSTFSPVSSCLDDGDITSTTMSGRLQGYCIEVSRHPALHGRVWLTHMLVVYHHRHAVREDSAGQSGALDSVVERPSDRPFQKVVACTLGRHRHHLALHQLIAPARLGHRPGQELGDGHAAGFRLRGHLVSVPQVAAG